MPPDPTLDHLEKTFVEAYRKELDQEENVWRSLPFFAATLAMQVAALAQVRDWLAATVGWTAWAAAVVLLLAAGATLTALFFLAWSILPTEFRYVAREPDLMRYAEAVRARAEADGASSAAASEVAHAALRATLVEQYALSTDHNRAVNQRRAGRRNRAGLATLCSVLLFVALVALAVISTVAPPSEARSHASPHAAAGPPDGAADPGARGAGTVPGPPVPGAAEGRAARTGFVRPGVVSPEPGDAGAARTGSAERAGTAPSATGSVRNDDGPGSGRGSDPPTRRRQPGPTPDQPRTPAPHARAP